MLSNQVPPLATYSGKDKDGVTFSDLREQLELVAGLCGWSDHVKLVNLATRLKGVAYAFYRSCTATQLLADSRTVSGSVHASANSVSSEQLIS